MSPHGGGRAAKERDLVDNHLLELHLLFFNVTECSSYKSDVNHTRNTKYVLNAGSKTLKCLG